MEAGSTYTDIIFGRICQDGLAKVGEESIGAVVPMGLCGRAARATTHRVHQRNARCIVAVTVIVTSGATVAAPIRRQDVIAGAGGDGRHDLARHE